MLRRRKAATDQGPSGIAGNDQKLEEAENGSSQSLSWELGPASTLIFNIYLCINVYFIDGLIFILFILLIWLCRVLVAACGI